MRTQLPVLRPREPVKRGDLRAIGENLEQLLARVRKCHVFPFEKAQEVSGVFGAGVPGGKTVPPERRVKQTFHRTPVMTIYRVHESSHDADGIRSHQRSLNQPKTSLSARWNAPMGTTTNLLVTISLGSSPVSRRT
jgi:hypothetical protein